MGLYDNVIIEDDIPELDVDHKLAVWQTKSVQTRPCMEKYKLEDGRLLKEDAEYNEVPKEERPYADDDDFEDNKLKQMRGMMKKEVKGWRDINYHGFVEIHTITKDDEYVSFDLKFSDGDLVEIEENDQRGDSRVR